MGTFLLALGILLLLWVAAQMFSALGVLGAIIFLLLVTAGVITAILKAWSRLNERLDRIEKALSIEEPPEEKELGEEQVPDESPEEI